LRSPGEELKERGLGRFARFSSPSSYRTETEHIIHTSRGELIMAWTWAGVGNKGGEIHRCMTYLGERGGQDSAKDCLTVGGERGREVWGLSTYKDRGRQRRCGP
jgi:hypothetical protein